MKRLDLILGELADQLLGNTMWGGVGKVTYYRHPMHVISKFSLKHRTKKNRRAELIDALKKCWLSESKFYETTDHYGEPIIMRFRGSGIYSAVRSYLKTYRERIKFLEAVDYSINIQRPDELPEDVSIYLDFGSPITEKRVGIHLLNPSVDVVKHSLESARIAGIEAVYMYFQDDIKFSGKRITRKGLAFNGTFRLTETDLDKPTS